MSQEVLAAAEEHKLRGNAHMQSHEYEQAIAAYSEAIELNPKATYWLNRAIAYRHAENWESAASDAALAVDLDSTNVKGHYIHALCSQQLRNYVRALQSCEIGLLMQADNKALLQIQREVLYAQEQQEFKAAKLAQVASIFGRETPRAPSSRGSNSSTSSSDGYMAPFRPAKKVPRALTEADAPYQELYAAAGSGNLDECNRLLASGKIENLAWQEPEDGNTALHAAADAGHEPVVRALLDAKADPVAVNDFDLVPFHLAEMDTETYKLLWKTTRRSDKDDRRRNAKKTLGAQMRHPAAGKLLRPGMTAYDSGYQYSGV